jgi:hypothetical protein
VPTLIHYTELRDLLARLEGKIIFSQAAGFRSSAEVRRNKSPVQAYALDEFTNGKRNPVVVAIGGNYTQDTVDTPREQYNFPNAVEADLSSNRRCLEKGFECCKKKIAIWEDKCAINSQSFIIPTEFHFVMTNFCIWITKRSWQKTSPQARTDLLENNPPLGSKSTAPGDWAHLAELVNDLDSVDVVWVGHGMHCEVFALFRQFIRSARIAKWMLLPNLAYNYNYDKWTFLK